MQTIQTQTAAFNPLSSPIRVLPDAREAWVTGRPNALLRGAPGMTWTEAMEAVAAHAAADGVRTDLGAGALDKLAIDFDSTGLLHICKTEQRNGQLVPGSDPMPLRKAAFLQLAARAGAPSGYIAKLPAKLARACMQHGLVTSEAGATGMIRLAAGQARAIVSGRYAALDDALVLAEVERALLDRGLLGTVQVRGLALGTTTVLRLTWAIGSIEVKRGDIVEGGIDIINGEIGNRSVGVTPSVYRLVCTNGMRVAETKGTRRLNHIGDPSRLYEAFRDAIPAAIEEAGNASDAMRAATEAMIVDVDAEFGGLASMGFSAAEVRDVTRTAVADRGLALPEQTSDWPDVLRGLSGDLSAFDVLNGMTAYAQTRGTDRRLEIEDAAGRYLRARTPRAA
jgi:hypothetical protein